jgi:murein DD-endopeptidase MepM/ murein hydrolase activator NlpD
MTVYLVKLGDTIWSIAKKYGVSSQSIIDANGLKNPNKLVVGQTLLVPIVTPGVPTNLLVQRNTLNSVVLFWEHAYAIYK